MTEDCYSVVLKLQDKMKYWIEFYNEDAEEEQEAWHNDAASFCASKAYGIQVALMHLEQLKRGT